MNKQTTLLFILILVSTVIVESVFAQVIPKPSVPEFSLKVVAYPYDVPPVYKKDEYTGKNVTIQSGYHVDNKSVEINVKNQPFTPFIDENNHYILLYYNISYKGNFGDDWNYFSYDSTTKYFLKQSNSTYTTISFTQIPTEGEIDFRVQALIGYYTEIEHPFMDVYLYNFTGQISDWSNTQTVTITSTSTEPTNTWLTWQLEIIIGIVIALVLVFSILLIYFKKHKQHVSQETLTNC